MIERLTGIAGGDGRVVVGPQTADDAGVFRFGDRALVATADFITPVCDDARRFGRVAATNALSDVFAMGGRALFGLNLCCFPGIGFPLEEQSEILEGAAEALRDAGAALLGGGLGLQIWAKHGDDDANAFVDRHISAGTFDQAALDEYNRRYESVLRRQKGAIALFAIGGASAVAGIVLVALGYAGGKQERQLRGPISWQPIVLRGGAGMVTEIRF